MIRRMIIAAVLAGSVACALAVDVEVWEDPSRLSLNKEPPTTLKPPVGIDLSGVAAWRFRWSRRPSERPHGFAKPSYDVSGWDLVTVPSSWQAMGIRPSGERYGVPIYLNMGYTFTPLKPTNSNCPPRVVGNDLPDDWTLGPDDNPVGSYRRDFEIPRDWIGDEIFIRFEAVESFFHLWINGEYVGFSKDSRNPAMFDITRWARAGANTVAAEVYRYCDGSYLECQDIFRLSGIIRPVTVSHQPKGAVRDVVVDTHPERRGDYAGDWLLSFRADRSDTAFELFDAGGAKVPTVSVGGGRWRVKSPALWSAEAPNLYTLVVDGRRMRVGFREVEITEPANPRDRMFLVNGQPVKLKGVNRAEVDPMFGHHCPPERLRQDIELIKKGNFNHIRNSHSPQPDEFYDLCDEYGIYVMDEANIESHGMGWGPESLSCRPEWEEAHLDRIRAMVCRNRNHPSVVCWSLGNEAGPGPVFKACHDWIRANDSRPVNYERNNFYADFGSRQYPDLYWLKATAAGEENVMYPMHVNEFAHNLNNGGGGVKAFQDVIESSNRIFGGALWDFADQALWAVDRTTGRRFLAFGGDFGEKPTEGQGMLDGIVNAERRAGPAYLEARHAYQPFDCRLAPDGKRVAIESKLFFRDSAAWECRVNGRVFPLRPLAPRERRLVPVAEFGAGPEDRFLNIEFVQREREGLFERGWVVAADQIALPGADAPVVFVPPALAAAAACESDFIVVTCGEWRYGFDSRTGSLASIRRDGRELLARPVFVDAFRAPVGGDLALGDETTSMIWKWGEKGLMELRPTMKRIAGPTREGSTVKIATLVAWRGERKLHLRGVGRCKASIEDIGAADPDVPGYHVATEWRFFGDGTLALKAAFRQFGEPTEVPRVGYRFVFAEPDMSVAYRARGPWDNYPDRMSGAFVADYACRAKEFFEPYGRSSDTGTRMEAHAVRLAETGLTFAGLGASVPAMQVCQWSPEEIIMNPHPALMPEPRKTELGLYAAQSGLGSRNCGPLPQTEMRVNPYRTHVLSVLVTPDPTLEIRSIASESDNWSAVSVMEPPKPKDFMMFPCDEAMVFGGRAHLRLAQMRFCSETFLWRFAPDIPRNLPVTWMTVKPRGASGRLPLVIFLNERGNHEYMRDQAAKPAAGRVPNDVSVFVVDNRASELTRGLHADPDDPAYMPIADMILGGCVVMTACCADACPAPEVEGGRGPESVYALWPKLAAASLPSELDVWAWLLSRGLDAAALDSDIDMTRVMVTGRGRLGEAAVLAAERDERFAAAVALPASGGADAVLESLKQMRSDARQGSPSP